MKQKGIQKQKVTGMSLKRTYYFMLATLIGLPIFVIFVVTLLVLNLQYRQKSIENIRQTQQTLITQLSADVDSMSLRMTSMIYANNYEVMEYAAKTNTDDMIQKSEYRERLDKVENLYLEPNKEVVSLYFLMKDGTSTYLKSYINHEKERFYNAAWYQNALKSRNKVFIGSYDTRSSGDLFIGGKKDMLILIGALSPDTRTDSSGNVRMVELYQSSKVADQIKNNNRAYLAGKNRLGITQITDGEGGIIFSTEDKKLPAKGDMCIRTPVQVYDSTWYIENYVRSGLLTEEFWHISFVLLGVAVLLFILIAYYSSYFVKSIVRPIEEVNHGLREIEDGKLDVRIEPTGQFEIRNMIMQFNAMVRRLRELFEEYEQKLTAGRSSAFYFRELLKGTITPAEAQQENRSFFQDPYVLVGMYVYGQEQDLTQLLNGFEKHARYAARCIACPEDARHIYLFYHVLEKDYEDGLLRMTGELQKMAEQESSLCLFCCIGTLRKGAASFTEAAEEIKESLNFRLLLPENGCIALNHFAETDRSRILEGATSYKKLADALFLADEKNMIQEREALFETLRSYELEEMRMEVYCVIIAIGLRAVQDGDSLSHVFGQQYDYIQKLDRIMDARSIRMWLTNFFNWILDYAASKLDVRENNMVVMAKRYIADRYENPDLSLKDVAAHVGLNEKYFSNRFTKEAGETMSEYLTAVRMQKAKELLKTTNFKVYEIAEMVGYQTVEHFNRVFKKKFQISPTAYRKSDKIE